MIMVMKRLLFIFVLLLTLFLLAFSNEKGFKLNNITGAIIPFISSNVEIVEDSSASLNEEDLFLDYALSRKVLKKDSNVSFVNQLSEPNTIYEIRDVFDLNAKTINIPENCVLKYEGGVLKNGTIVGNNTTLEGPASVILDETINFIGTDNFHINRIYFPKGKDISTLAQRMLDVFNLLELQTGTYYLSSPLILKGYYTKIKGSGKRTVIKTKGKLDYAIRTAFDSEVENPGKFYNASFVEISDLMIDGGSSKKFKNGIFLDGPSCMVNNCFVTNIESIGVKLGEWCNNLNYCTITHCNIGVLITQRANAVNVCFNRIESNKVNLVVNDYRGVYISKNTLEGGELFNIVVGKGYACNIKDNYFEGSAGNVSNNLTTTDNRTFNFSGKKEIKGIIWIGPILLSEKNGITKVSYKVGSTNAPTTVFVEGNYVDIHPDDYTKKTTDPEIFFALIGSCLDYCVINNNTFTHTQNAVCGFFDMDSALLGNVEILNNYVAGTTHTNNSIDYIQNDYTKRRSETKNRIVGKMILDKSN